MTHVPRAHGRPIAGCQSTEDLKNGCSEGDWKNDRYT